jgi:16S rRNA (adenine1518-N6/adenine1519-N6)-dimethyltransferase
LLRRPPLNQWRAPRNDVHFKIVSNLPYYITSPVLFWLIENRSLIEKSVLMMQREVANRLLAQPGDKDYGRLTLGVRYYAEVHRAFDVSRNCFTPKPVVDSSVITLDFHPLSKLPQGLDEDLLFHIIRIAFGARRKILLNRLSKDGKVAKSRPELVEILNKLGIPENARPEDLLLKDFIALAEELRAC